MKCTETKSSLYEIMNCILPSLFMLISIITLWHKTDDLGALHVDDRILEEDHFVYPKITFCAKYRVMDPFLC